MEKRMTPQQHIPASLETFPIVALFLKLFWGGIPFMMMSNDGKLKLNIPKIMEGILIAILTSALVGLFLQYVFVNNISTKLIYIEKQVELNRTTIQNHIDWDTTPGQGMRKDR